MELQSESESSPPPQICLNEEQSRIFETISNRNNTLITGGGGVGKSFTLKYIVNWARNRNINYGLCAMTGSAALIIDGTTLHSYLGIGLAKETAEQLVVNKIFKNKRLKTKLTDLHMLIIDEISMLNDDLFTKVSNIFKILQDSELPFGGIQMILVGDLFQLAPVEGNYCFISPEWDNTQFTTFLLKTNMRQKDDIEFKELLERLRWGQCSKEDYKTLIKLKDTTFPEDIIPTKLYSTNKDVDNINAYEFDKLFAEGSEIQTRTYTINYPTNPTKNVATKNWVKSSKIQETITLCVGAQVMLTYNINQVDGLINGTRGVVVELLCDAIRIKLVDESIVRIDYIKYKSDENQYVTCSYLPIILAWAITIHKSQGATLDALEIDLGKNIFAYGQAYTALSRARNLKSIKLVNVLPTSFKASPAVIAFYKDIM